jgi:L-alanine-DL-glutamate epimerase-like enolase superfamily enzyme
MLAAYDVGWFEEALRPDALDDFVELRRKVRFLSPAVRC